MRLINQNSVWAVAILVLLGLSCSKVDEQKHIVGIWKIFSINVNGMEVGDGRGFINFRPDGKNEVRTAEGLYEFGKWEMVPAQEEIIMKDDSTGAHYKYKMWGDSLLMTMNRPNQVTVLRLNKVDKYPVDPASEGVSPDAFK